MESLYYTSSGCGMCLKPALVGPYPVVTDRDV